MAKQKQDTETLGLDQLVAHISAQLRDTIRRAVEQSVDEGFQAAQALAARVPAPVAKRPVGRPARSLAAVNDCLVPRCGRDATARGLCQTHYAKARRMGFNEEKLNSDQLATLGRDGRKARFSGQAR